MKGDSSSGGRIGTLSVFCLVLKYGPAREDPAIDERTIDRSIDTSTVLYSSTNGNLQRFIQ
jgi:hypothetical protein